jgi:hypothetical protein
MATKFVMLRCMHFVQTEIVIGNKQVTMPVNRPCNAVVGSFVATPEPLLVSSISWSYCV